MNPVFNNESTLNFRFSTIKNLDGPQLEVQRPSDLEQPTNEWMAIDQTIVNDALDGAAVVSVPIQNDTDGQIEVLLRTTGTLTEPAVIQGNGEWTLTLENTPYQLVLAKDGDSITFESDEGTMSFRLNDGPAQPISRYSASDSYSTATFLALNGESELGVALSRTLDAGKTADVAVRASNVSKGEIAVDISATDATGTGDPTFRLKTKRLTT